MSNRVWQPGPGTPLDRNDSLSHGLLLSPVTTAGNGVWDATGQKWSVVSGSGAPTGLPGRNGNAVRFTQSLSNYLANSTISTPTAAATVLLLTRPRSSSSTGSAFGNALTEADGNRIQAHIPYSGTIYWDFGSYNTGGRVSYTPSAGYWGVWHRMAFRAGPRQGQSIWEDGIVKVSQGTALTRTASTGFYAGAGHSLTNDNDVEALWLYNRELTDSEIRRWSVTPYAMYAPPATVPYAIVGASPPPSTLPWMIDGDFPSYGYVEA